MMNDYKELIEQLNGACYFKIVDGDISKADLFARAVDAIEQLVKERNAAVDDLSMHGRYCVTCAHSTIDGAYVWPCNDKRLRCATDDNKNWEWRGVQEDNNG